MATVERDFLHSQLRERRERLQAVIAQTGEAPELARLMQEVDAALERMNQGTYGICEACHEPVEKERLLADPLVCYCLDHLTAEQQRALQLDLELAARIQRGLLPRQNLCHAGWETYYHYQPLGPVSGDYCDLVHTENGSGNLFFALGDVSGKGVAASMLMSQLHAMFRSLTSAGVALDQLVALANRVFCESTTAGQYATLVCGRADQAGQVEICNAGHCPTFLVRDREIARLQSTGVPLGMFSSAGYAFEAIQLQHGDTLVLYTDGLSEARDPAGAEYGVERLARLLGEKRGLSPQPITVACLADLQAFSAGAEKTDDLTILVLRRAS